jgi:hypothetical protein
LFFLRTPKELAFRPKLLTPGVHPTHLSSPASSSTPDSSPNRWSRTHLPRLHRRQLPKPPKTHSPPPNPNPNSSAIFRIQACQVLSFPLDPIFHWLSLDARVAPFPLGNFRQAEILLSQLRDVCPFLEPDFLESQPQLSE